MAKTSMFARFSVARGVWGQEVLTLSSRLTAGRSGLMRS